MRGVLLAWVVMTSVLVVFECVVYGWPWGMGLAALAAGLMTYTWRTTLRGPRT